MSPKIKWLVYQQELLVGNRAEGSHVAAAIGRPFIQTTKCVAGAAGPSPVICPRIVEEAAL